MASRNDLCGQKNLRVGRKRPWDEVGQEPQQNVVLTVGPFSRIQEMIIRNVAVGSLETRTFMIKNTGTGNTVVQLVHPPSAEHNIHLNSTKFIISGNEEIQVTLTWRPKKAGSWYETLHFINTLGLRGAIGLDLEATSAKKAKCKVDDHITRGLRHGGRRLAKAKHTQRVKSAPPTFFVPKVNWKGKPASANFQAFPTVVQPTFPKFQFHNHNTFVLSTAGTARHSKSYIMDLSFKPKAASTPRTSRMFDSTRLSPRALKFSTLSQRRPVFGHGETFTISPPEPKGMQPSISVEANAASKIQAFWRGCILRRYMQEAATLKQPLKMTLESGEQLIMEAQQVTECVHFYTRIRDHHIDNERTIATLIQAALVVLGKTGDHTPSMKKLDYYLSLSEDMVPLVLPCVNNLLKVLMKNNRSLTAMYFAEPASSLLLNLAKHPVSKPTLWQNPNLVPALLVLMVASKTGTGAFEVSFNNVITILWLLASDDKKREELKSHPGLHFKLQSTLKVVESRLKNLASTKEGAKLVLPNIHFNKNPKSFSSRYHGLFQLVKLMN